jgi:hypothetical protein
MRAQEIERRKYDTEEEKIALIPELRGVSRQEYLKKREEQKLAELKEALEDEERLFEVGGRANFGSVVMPVQAAACVKEALEDKERLFEVGGRANFGSGGAACLGARDLALLSPP